MMKRLIRKGNNMETNRSITKSARRIALATGLILLVPLVAMRFSDEVAWGPMDFIVAGVLLTGMGLIFELVVRRLKNPTQRVTFGIVLAIVFLLIWMDLAVGIFGTPISGD